MANLSDGGSWEEHRLHVNSSLVRIEAKQDEILKDITTLKVKAALHGAFYGAIAAVFVTLFALFLEQAIAPRQAPAHARIQAGDSIKFIDEPIEEYGLK